MDAFSTSSRPSNSLATTLRTQPTDHPESSPVYSISPLLLERLQRSRRVENERVSARSSADMLSSSTNSRHVRSPSPTGSQQLGSGGGLDHAKAKTGLGVKEMEQTLSTLHKQNFDLKLEVYHRRERQTALEKRLETLEREAKERDDLNDTLVHELEKRDKAVEEAIGMILTLEKRVEQLLLERNMVRQVEVEGAAYPRVDSPVVTPAPKKNMKFERMPSFVSERSENTENLRNVYLDALGCESAATLPRLAEDTPDTTRMDPRLASPAMSELSESSFISIYGRGRTADLSSPPGNSPWPWDGSSRTPVPVLESPARVRTSTPSRQHRPSGSRATSGQYHNIGDVLDTDPSPLQRLGKAEGTRAAMRGSPKPTAASKGNDQSPFARPPILSAQPKTKKEKREALERVLTQGHFSSPQTLPPTPDTLSTTTLPHNDTPSKEQDFESDRSLAPPTERTTARALDYDHKFPPRAAQAASTMASDGRKYPHITDASSYNPMVAPDSHYPRTAADVAPGRARTRDGNTWGGDASRYKPTTRRDSATSSVDTWLRESLKPDSMDALDPMSSISQAHASTKNSRTSPDLFSFPTSSSGWASHAMFGALGGSGYVRAGGKNASIPIADMLDAIGASASVPSSGRRTPIHGTAPTAPQPPNRRSSLLTRPGSTADATHGTESTPRSPPRPAPPVSAQMKTPARGNRTRSNSTDVRPPTHHLTELGLKQDRAMTVPPKQRHYPPTTSRPRSRGLNNFFRRSTGSADAPQPPASAPPTETPFKPPPPPTGMGMGIPSWVRRSSLVDDDDRASATPPPIVRNKNAPAGGLRVGDDEDGDGGVALEAPPAAGDAPAGAVPCGGGSKPSSRKSWGGHGGGGESGEGGGVSLGGGGGGGSAGEKRKWLGLARVSSLRNRGGT
ncbi:hypothetical protein C8A00DRAFT_16134 [Chaetomidium leptoderma]|uniref:Centrosomin N-terminal motif 1 domain-containing protein n=1 Tax=Chaetomidium leptoderma TaxID=669021 RepID=A0AAN6ZW79_9PEZI|nr:hypothetical protein C8A00DRAFT_16134 [Chaetomidium leptoderma]